MRVPSSLTHNASPRNNGPSISCGCSTPFTQRAPTRWPFSKSFQPTTMLPSKSAALTRLDGSLNGPPMFATVVGWVQVYAVASPAVSHPRPATMLPSPLMS